jgi:hypothetical protein
MKIITISSIFLLLFIGCGEENNITETNSTSLSTKNEKHPTNTDTIKSISTQPEIEEKQILKNDTPKEEPLENFASPKTEEEFLDEQSTTLNKIEEEPSEESIPVKSKEELLDENPNTKRTPPHQKSAEELADEKSNQKG